MDPTPAPYHRDLGFKPLPAERSALLNERREYHTYVKNYETDVWDVEKGGADEDYYGCRERLEAIDAALDLQRGKTDGYEALSMVTA